MLYLVPLSRRQIQVDQLSEYLYGYNDMDQNLTSPERQFGQLKDCIKVIAFDADDTLWENEYYFRRTEDAFCALFVDYLPSLDVQRRMYQVEVNNLPWYGYGIKGFILSMIETALGIANEYGGDLTLVGKIIALGKKMLDEPVLLMEGVETVLSQLRGKYRLIVATKGDLLDQERKLKKSGLIPFFHHIEVMTEKNEESYLKLLKHLDIQASELLMIGNSLKSDVLPVLNLGGFAVHIPFEVTCIHEQVKEAVQNARFKHLLRIEEILAYL